MYSLRQKTYGVFIRPYVTYDSDRIVERGTVYTQTPGSGSGYMALKDGSAWMLYKGEYITSFTLVRERVKEVMDTLGYSKNDIIVAEIAPIDVIVTPLT